MPLGRQPLGDLAVPALRAPRRCAGTGSRRRGRRARGSTNHVSGRYEPCPRHEHRRAPSLSGARSPLRPEDELLVSVVIPCLNEAANIERCVSWARTTLAEHGIARRGRGGRQRLRGRSPPRSRSPPAPASSTSAAAATATPTWPASPPPSGRYIVMADADLTYDFGEIPRFLEQLEDGADLVMGDRMDGIQPGAMPWLHRYIGNPMLSGTLNLFFRTGVRDAHCGMRAFRRDRLPRARPAHHRHGVRLGDGDPRRQGEARHPPAADRLPPARRHLQALELPRRLAPPALPARPLADAPVRHPRRG